MSAFYPQFSLIQAITPGIQTVVTFTANCDFTPGEVVSFRVSPANGTVELNNVQATVVSNTSDTITVNIDSRNYTPFVYTTENIGQFVAMVVPSSSGILPRSFPAATTLVDAFDNIPNT